MAIFELFFSGPKAHYRGNRSTFFAAFSGRTTSLSIFQLYLAGNYDRLGITKRGSKCIPSGRQNTVITGARTSIPVIFCFLCLLRRPCSAADEVVYLIRPTLFQLFYICEYCNVKLIQTKDLKYFVFSFKFDVHLHHDSYFGYHLSRCKIYNQDSMLLHQVKG